MFRNRSFWTILSQKIQRKIKQGYTSSALKKKKDLAELNLLDIINAANNEDMLSIELLAEVGEKLGKGLAVLINLFNPELLILGVHCRRQETTFAFLSKVLSINIR